MADLYRLLDGEEWWIHEVVAEPLARLAGVAALPALLDALERDIAAGWDCDGLQHIIAWLIEAQPAAAFKILRPMLSNADPSARAGAAWALSQLEEVPPQD